MILFIKLVPIKGKRHPERVLKAPLRKVTEASLKILQRHKLPINHLLIVKKNKQQL
jgi:hypothetical protein